MWILNNKAGYMLLEVVCSMSIFMIIMFTMIMVIDNTVKMKNNQEQIIKYGVILDSIKNEILWNLDLPDTDNISKKGICYIECNNININKIRENSIKSIITEDKPNKYPYGEINIESEYSYKVKLKIHYLYYSEVKEVFCEFIKGKY